MGVKMENLEKELEKRVWPEKPKYTVKRYIPYVTYGRIENRSLRLFQSLSEPIPPEECAITSLCRGKNRKIYGASSGRKSHLFYYSFSPEGDGVCDIGIIEGAKSIKNSLCVDKNGIIWGGVSEGEKGFIFRYDTSKDFSVEYGTTSGKIEIVIQPFSDEFILCLICDEKRNILYGISSENGYLFLYDIEKNEVSIKGQIDKNKLFSPVLVMDEKGNVYCCGAFGQLKKYNPDEDKFEELPLYIPSIQGRSFYNRLSAGVYNEYDGFIYFGTSGDGILSAFNPENNFIRTIGKITAESEINALTCGNDGIVYGICGEKDGMAHLFSYDPDNYSLNYLGIPYATSEIPWHGYEFSCACTGEFGEIYLGESDRISHLFIYFPPIKKRKREIKNGI